MEKTERPAAALIGAIIGLARATEGNANRPDEAAHSAMLSAMRCALPGTAVEEGRMEERIQSLHREKERLVPRCAKCKKACGRNNDFDLRALGQLEPELAAVKNALLSGLLALEPLMRGQPAGGRCHEAMEFLYKGFFFIGCDCEKERLLPLLAELEAVRNRLLQESSS